jgi:hypothetical protein
VVPAAGSAARLRRYAFSMTSPDVSRKVRQLDHDVQEIYVMLTDISVTQRRQGLRLEEIASAQEAMDAKVGSLDAKVGSLDAKVGSLDAKVDSQGAKLDEILRLLRP